MPTVPVDTTVKPLYVSGSVFCPIKPYNPTVG